MKKNDPGCFSRMGVGLFKTREPRVLRLKPRVGGRLAAVATLAAVVGAAGLSPSQSEAQSVGAGEPGVLGVVVAPASQGFSLAAEPLEIRGPQALLPLTLTLPEGVHVYWHNPGEAGLPPRVNVTLPEGWESEGQAAAPLFLPPPIRFESGGVVGFGYETQLNLVAPVAMSEAVEPGATGLAQVRVRFLACDADRCVPGSATFSVPVVAGDPQATDASPALAAIESRYDAQGPPVQAVAEEGDAQFWRFPLGNLPAGASEVEFFPAPRDLALARGHELGLHLIESTPKAIRDSSGAWFVSARTKPVDSSTVDSSADGSNPAVTIGVVGYAVDGERRGRWLVAERHALPPSP